MPRGRCHFALLYHLHERIRSDRPDAAAVADRHLPSLVAGSAAPDGMRYVGQLGKMATHFYVEDRRETWGKAVEGLFREHPDLSDPDRLAESDRALVMGYISHLTVDEAFRDIITSQVHGQKVWRPTIKGLWSIVDEIPVGYPDLVGQVDRFTREDTVGLIDCGVLRQYLTRIRGWAQQSDPWDVELLFLALTEDSRPVEEAQREWEQNRSKAAEYIDDERCGRFVDAAVDLAAREIGLFLDGAYSQKAGDR